MARNLVRDERQGDLFGAPPAPSTKPPRRTPAPKLERVEEPASARAAPTTPVKALTKPTIDEILEDMPDRELADLVVEATRLVKRRLARGQGRGLRSKGAGRQTSPLTDALHRIGRELMEFEDSDALE